MSNEQNLVQLLPIRVGDMCVEVVGNEPRFWVASSNDKGSIKLNMVARSFTFMGKRMLQWIAGEKILEGAETTVARLYSRKDRASGAAVVRKFFPEAGTIHFYYSGKGPSGDSWYGADGRYSIPR